MVDIARQRKVADRIRTTVAKLLERRIKDPRIGFVTITDCQITADLQHATVFYTVYGKASERKATAHALNSAKGLIRSEVGKALGIRLTPSISFVPDALPTQAASFEDALARAKAADEVLKKQAEQAQYAGGEDPYRKPRESEEIAADFETGIQAEVSEEDEGFSVYHPAEEE